jgi:phosphoribosylpyrophosphate synthetase
VLKVLEQLLAMVFYQVQHIKRIAKSSLTELVISDSLTSNGYKISTISVADQIGLGIMAINSKSSYEYLKKKDFKMSKKNFGKIL